METSVSLYTEIERICPNILNTYSDKIDGNERARVKKTNLNMMIEVLER